MSYVYKMWWRSRLQRMQIHLNEGQTKRAKEKMTTSRMVHGECSTCLWVSLFLVLVDTLSRRICIQKYWKLTDYFIWMKLSRFMIVKQLKVFLLLHWSRLYYSCLTTISENDTSKSTCQHVMTHVSACNERFLSWMTVHVMKIFRMG